MIALLSCPCPADHVFWGPDAAAQVQAHVQEQTGQPFGKRPAPT